MSIIEALFFFLFGIFIGNDKTRNIIINELKKLNEMRKEHVRRRKEK